MSPPQVIVFGPTGAVGSSAARIAHSLGAPVALAMRDTSKRIPGLSSSEESAGTFARIPADLTDADSVAAAAKKTNSKHAFIYLARHDGDDMRGTLTALKDSGIEFVVFLSTFSIQGPIREVKEQDYIPWTHAQVEINLEEIFGQGKYIALRPGSFANNNMQYLPGIKRGEVSVWTPEATVDCIAPEDIGRVAGAMLVNGVPSDGNTTPYLIGPRLYTQGDAIRIMAKLLDQSVEIKPSTRTEMRSAILAMQYPEQMVDYMLNQTAKTPTLSSEAVFGIPIKKEWAGNVERYSGFEPTSFEAWVKANLTNV